MANFEIDIDIDSKGVRKIIDAGQYVTVVKQVKNGSASRGAAEPLPVAWVAFQPDTSNNLSWQEEYYLYEANVILEAGVTISQKTVSDSPVEAQYVYPFHDNTFQSPTSGGAPGQYSVRNLEPDTTDRAFGLAQEVTVGGTTTVSPINAMRVIKNETATFEPYETVSIFLSGVTDNGTVIASVVSDALTIKVPADSPVKVGFNDDEDTFYKL